MKPFVRAQYNYDTNEASRASGLACLDKSKTQQQFAEEADINTIVNKFLKTGQLPTDLKVPRYGDFDEVTDFHTAMNAVREAQEGFDRLPAQMRARFHNDPQELLAFIEDPENTEEAVKLGLLTVTGEPPQPAPEAPAAPATPQVAPSKEGTT